VAHLVLVEDERDARRMLELGLTRLGHMIRGYANGQEALNGIDGQTELIITDLIMPTMDGLTLLRTLSEREHPARRIVITSFADKDRTVQALNLGVDFLMEKPFSVERLQEVITAVLAKSRGVGTVEQLFQRQLCSLEISERERQMIVYLLKGLPNADIARLCGTSENAIKSALFTLYRKLGVSSRGELFHLIFPI